MNEDLLLAALLFSIPVGVTIAWFPWYGRLFEKSIGSYRARDFLFAMAVLCGGSLATIMTFLLARGAYLQLS